MLVHHRHFPREDGVYSKLEKSITVKGSICRADWVDGASTRCRTVVSEGEERRGWLPSGCSLCNTLRSSPCCDIFARLVVLESRHGRGSEEFRLVLRSTNIIPPYAYSFTTRVENNRIRDVL